ncbi:hypothetical protein [Murimonas intestini]|uniref:hypothetical protein n=1 Tax=Murimonas intestini TaxID=1337051 RepID=UPI0016528EB6|nr:hypothetical protein [Murimonas intestini]
MKRTALFCAVLCLIAGAGAGAASCGRTSEKYEEPVTEVQAEVDIRMEYASWEAWHLK